MRATTALNKISALNKRIWVIQGGQGAGKTYSILTILINHASNNPDKEIIIASAELTKMRLTVIKDFVKIMKSFGLFDKRNFKAETKYQFKNNSFIKFIGLDKEDIGKGLRCDVLFLNEANKTNFENYREISSRAKKIIIDYNPNVTFWADEHVKNRDDSQTLILTYLDNEYLSPEEIFEIENYKKQGFINPELLNYDTEDNIKSQYWANKWRVYGLGQYGQVEGAIYTNWRTGSFDATIPYRFGLDFGFSNDPDALVKIAVDEKRKIIYMHECFYNNNQSSELLRTNLSLYVARNERIIADSQEARLISDLKKHFNIIPAIKWHINERIKKMQGYELIITPSSTNLIEEITSYVWSDKKAQLPIDKNNHLLDAAGYALTGQTNPKGIRKMTFK